MSEITMKNIENQAVNACIAIHQKAKLKGDTDEPVLVAHRIGGEVLKLLSYEFDQPVKSEELSGAEALFGFMGWLTSRSEISIFSSSHDAGLAVELIKEFCKFNKLKDPC